MHKLNQVVKFCAVKYAQLNIRFYMTSVGLFNILLEILFFCSKCFLVSI